MRDHPPSKTAQAKDPKQLFSELWAALAKAQDTDAALSSCEDAEGHLQGELVDEFQAHVDAALEAFGELSETSFFAETSATLDVTFAGRP